MVSDEHANEQVNEHEGDQLASEPAAKKNRKRPAIAVGVIVAVLVVAGAGFWVWHETPGFCSAICHTPMDAYGKAYAQEANTTGVDKWGNEVSDTSAMLAVSHQVSEEDGGASATCLSCHVPTISEQVSEGMSWLTGDYTVVANDASGSVLPETELSQLTAARGADSEEFCLNESCHDLTRDELTKLTSDLAFNPHDTKHGERVCSDCHKAHRASVYVCAECHAEAELPSGWITPDEADRLENKA